MRLKSDAELVQEAVMRLGMESKSSFNEDEFDRIRELAHTLRKRQAWAIKQGVRGPRRLRTDQVVTRYHSGSESPIEEILLLAMNTRSVLIGEFVQQYSIGPYFLDFALLKVKLYVEADGKAYHSEPGQIERDRRRGEYLASLGWTAIRFSGRQINADPYACVDRITAVYESLLNDSGSKEPWEGRD